jgi:hypothetical protein
LEDLSNELIYEIFDSLDIYHIYQAFFYLNKRFKNLLINSILPIKINISSISKSNFQLYYSNIIIPNKHRIISLRLSNFFLIDNILSLARTFSKFLRLETLILDNIKAKHLENILNDAIYLPNLCSLVISSVDYLDNSNNIYRQIFRLPVLKYCKLSLKAECNSELLPICENEYSSIENLILDSVTFDEFDRLLSYVPQLHKLSIQCLDGVYCKRIELLTIKFNYLTHISFDFHHIYFNQFEILVKNFFSHIQVLHLSTGHDNRREQLILSYMPYLCIFQLNFRDSVYGDNHDQSSYDVLINKFNSSFWVERHCFFTFEQENRWGNIGIEIFYSTDPYKYESDLCNTYVVSKLHRLTKLFQSN